MMSQSSSPKEGEYLSLYFSKRHGTDLTAVHRLRPVIAKDDHLALLHFVRIGQRFAGIRPKYDLGRLADPIDLHHALLVHIDRISFHRRDPPYKPPILSVYLRRINDYVVPGPVCPVIAGDHGQIPILHGRIHGISADPHKPEKLCKYNKEYDKDHP